MIFLINIVYKDLENTLTFNLCIEILIEYNYITNCVSNTLNLTR
jgi:hypothetical protein